MLVETIILLISLLLLSFALSYILCYYLGAGNNERLRVTPSISSG